MKKIWKILAITLLSSLVIAALGGIFLFKRVQDRLRPPKLIVQSVPETDFAFRTLDGTEKHLSDFRGKVVFLDLWGTWCIQCVAEMPTVQSLYNRYKDDPAVAFLIVSRLDSPQAVRRYASRTRFDLPFYVTRDEDVPASMYLNQYPATFIYAKDGSLTTQHAGGADWSDSSVTHFIDQLKNR